MRPYVPFRQLTGLAGQRVRLVVGAGAERPARLRQPCPCLRTHRPPVHGDEVLRPAHRTARHEQRARLHHPGTPRLQPLHGPGDAPQRVQRVVRPPGQLGAHGGEHAVGVGEPGVQFPGGQRGPPASLAGLGDLRLPAGQRGRHQCGRLPQLYGEPLDPADEHTGLGDGTLGRTQLPGGCRPVSRIGGLARFVEP